ncbi:hypothetical protein HPG69_014021 [Diceros bicornis minor]|uniref:Uncharacterized protein n=1 Tax=Diceros bicornis minor TaxID=77932 RepID=A0A7J7ENB6_DICBM|nr:hypothetical protein HPG69_014021 [Diceros bicornis minor]
MVEEGPCISMPSIFSYPWESRTDSAPIHGYWFQKVANPHQDAPVATKCKDKSNNKSNLLSVGVTGKEWDPGVAIGEGHAGFRAGLGWDLSSGKTALTHTPHILILGTLECGGPRNWTCSVPSACEQGTFPIFFWKTAGLTSLSPRTRLSSVRTLTPRPQDLSTNLTYQVKFPAAGVTAERTIQLNITCECWAQVPEEGKGALHYVLKRRRHVPVHQDWSSPQVSLVCRGTRDQGKSDSGGHQGSWCHCTARSLPLPHLLHSEDLQEESSQDSSGHGRHPPCHQTSFLKTPERIQVSQAADPTSSAGNASALEMEKDMH